MAAVGVFASPVSLVAADWPGFGGPTFDRMAPDTQINKEWSLRPPKVLWTTPMSDGGFAGASVADGKVFIVDHRGAQDMVRAIDVATGKDVWSFAYGELSQNRFGFTESTPLYDAGKLYTFSKLGKVHCLDAATGKRLWMRDAFKDFAGRRPEWDFAASPAMADGRLILYPGGKGASVVALDAADGRTLWKAGESVVSYSTPQYVTLNQKKQVITFVGDGLAGLDPATGARLWFFPWQVDHDQNSAQPIIAGSTIFFSTAWGKGSVLLDVAGDRPVVLWKSLEMQSRFASPVLHDGRIYGTHDSGQLVCLDAKSGALLWKQPGFEFASTIAVDGCIVVQEGKSGDLILLDAQTPQYKELGRFRPLGGPDCWSSPVISDGRMIVRNKKTLACVDLR